MVRDRSREAENLAFEEDRMKEKDVLKMLTAGIRVIHHEEIALGQRFLRIQRKRGLEDLPDRAELHGNQFGLSDGVATIIKKCRRTVAGLPQNG
jgi:hypothetical protein